MDSLGSDSAPSQDNLDQEELTRIGDALQSRRRSVRRKHSRGTCQHGMRRTTSQNLRAARVTRHKTRANSASRRVDTKARTAVVPRAQRAEFQRIVAFGQTTYVQGSIRPQNLASGSSEPSSPAQRQRPPHSNNNSNSNNISSNRSAQPSSSQDASASGG